jgi:hypothetical protein
MKRKEIRMSDEQLGDVRNQEEDTADVDAHAMGQPREAPREAMDEPPDVEGHVFHAPREAPRD